MEISIINENDKCIIKQTGRLNAVNSDELNKVIEESLNNGVKNIILDFKNVEYIASSGLRILLITKKRLMYNGNFEIINVSDSVKEIFDVTGFSEIFNIGG